MKSGAEFNAEGVRARARGTGCGGGCKKCKPTQIFSRKTAVTSRALRGLYARGSGLLVAAAAVAAGIYACRRAAGRKPFTPRRRFSLPPRDGCRTLKILLFRKSSIGIYYYYYYYYRHPKPMIYRLVWRYNRTHILFHMRLHVRLGPSTPVCCYDNIGRTGVAITITIILSRVRCNSLREKHAGMRATKETAIVAHKIMSCTRCIII